MMDDDDYPYYMQRNDYFEEQEDRYRNRPRPRPRPRPRIAVGTAAMAPWQQPRPIVVEPARKGIRDMPTGLLAEVVAQAFVAFQPLPNPPPPMTGDVRADLGNLVTYQTALAQHQKRNEQIRTVGYLARLFV
jgi:hypothetical protein